MAAPAYPPVLLEAIAADAGGGFITNPIPDAPTGTNAASIQGGFPPVTMQSELSGGQPPLGQDMNGFLFLLSSHLTFLQSGQLYQFDADVSTAIGGYPAGAVLAMADSSGLWLCTANGNTTNPDTAPFGDNIGWIAVYSNGVGVMTGLTGGQVPIPNAQSKKSIVVLSGALSSNLQINMPRTVQSWLFVNNTTGAFTTTVGTTVGTGVTVPQGGYAAPTGVYSVGDGNIYPTVAPLGLPISQTNVPLSIAERDNLGNLIATAFIALEAQANESPSFLWSDFGNGSLNRVPLTYAEAIMQLSAIGGQVANGQVPQSAVTQYAAAILASAALTGIPTAPTAAAGTATSQVASTAFVNPGSGSTGAGRYRKNPDGTIDQWGSFNVGGGGGVSSHTFPIAFPSALESLTYGILCPGGTGGAGSYVENLTAASAAGFTYTTNTASAATIYWRASGT
jgi:hypothetical protein